ncbi:uncharacterized protein K452DRAFT_275565 [Aplosporella prunicola CBS 121167]|uniref:F-box domain-containing protein n=1 Tax=Aplosporella prunicola CBS 121167 TaxID=1176127 RepID=A0A6A6B5C6_9PEZI|nr:uncharacterized protein K452DRAFT_275565 [Aplosporella prunicola CBS 121167]KAF2139349.1 hypothetical protein K452DRAFT_275565 [Aplosporella prunicola CBS 121167]
MSVADNDGPQATNGRGSPDRQTPEPRQLPDDVLHLFCAELAHQRDFDSLFQCALVGKCLALPALTYLYRCHHLSPVRDGGSEAVALSQQALMVQKWSIMWRSIIASGLDMTLFPYCRYIKVLNLRDLQYLLEDDKFRGALTTKFFAGGMSRFKVMIEFPPKRGAKKRPARLDINTAINAIGEVLTQHTPTLEQISGNIQSSALINWAPRLPRLKSLELWQGQTLAESQAQAAIHENCPQFDALSFYTWEGEDVDEKLSGFIGGMKPHQLRYFEVISRSNVGAETCLSLNTQGESLKTLKLALKTSALEHLSLLKSCTALETLELEHIDVSTHPTDLEKTQNDVYHDMGEWLRACKSLTSLHFTGFPSAPPLVTPLLLDNDTNLCSLKVDWYAAAAHRDFHRALAHQPKLQSLSLSGMPETMGRDDVDTLIESLIQLKELRELKLTGVSDYFNDEHIISLAENLQHLEEVYFTGLSVGDAILPQVSTLKNLRRIDIAAMSSFTADGLLGFASKLGPGNKGIIVSVDAADMNTMLATEEIGVVRDVLLENVDGRLEYQPWRDPEVSDFEASDSE